MYDDEYYDYDDYDFDYDEEQFNDLIEYYQNH